MISERDKRDTQKGSKPPRSEGARGGHKARLQGILENTDSNTWSKEAEFVQENGNQKKTAPKQRIKYVCISRF